jgi:uroporphyrinogen-III synthase
LTRIWVTRAEPGASATAARLRALGFEPVTAPLIATRPLAVDLDLTGVGALAFTSAAGVAAFAALTSERRLPVYAVGSATAQAASEASFAVVISADGDVAALASRIAADHGRIAGVVLHAAAAAPAGDLAGALARAGVETRSVAVYETVPADPPVGFLDQIGSLAGVLVHSPSAGARLAQVLAGVAAPRLFACCLSPAVAQTLAGLALDRIVAATLPNEDALLSLLVDQVKAHNGDR